MNRILLIYLSFFFHSHCCGQNLVPNPSFEEHNMCQYFVWGPGGYPQNIVYSPNYDSFPTVLSWVAPLQLNTPDYFNICDTITNGHGTPYNGFGYQVPRTGNAYAGIVTYCHAVNSWKNYREYIEARINKPLIEGHIYKVHFFVSLATSHFQSLYGTVWGINNVGLLLSDTMVVDSMGFITAYLQGPTSIKSPTDMIISDTTNWLKIESTYTAKGGERWLTIGRFRDSTIERDSLLYTISDPTYSNDEFNYSYLYIDDVCIMDLSDSTSDTTICANSFPITIKPAAYDGGDFSWNTGETTAGITVNKPGIYWRKATGECVYHIDTFKVLTKPYLTLGSDRDVCPYPVLVLNNDMPVTTYLWNTGETTCCIPITQSGTYAVTARNACGTENASVHLNLMPACDTCLWAPTAFTPNNDGTNDVFRVRSRCQLSDFTMKVYNRIGQQVFETNDMANGWDGTFNGIPQDVGVFYYYLNYTAITATGNTGEVVKGDVTLVR